MSFYVDRWHFGTLPEKWDDAQGFLRTALGELERTLHALHGAIEHPRVSTVARIDSSADTVISSTSPADITGVTHTFTPEVDMQAVVFGAVTAGCTLFGAITHRLFVHLYVNGAEVSPAVQASTAGGALNDRRQLAQQWVVALTSGTEYTLKLRASLSDAATQWTTRAPHTGMTLLLVPDPYEVASSF